MDVATIKMDQDEAQALYDQYKAALDGLEATPEDAKILLGYKALAKGKEVVDLIDVFRACPVDDQGRPKLAFCRADWKWCEFWADSAEMRFSPWRVAAGYKQTIRIPTPRLPGLNLYTSARAMVPLVPAPVRPKGDLSKYHILWEAEWQAVPTDPLLLQRLCGSLFVVLAAWDLTELERAVLAGRFREQS